MDDAGRAVRQWAALCTDDDLRLLARLGDGGGLPFYTPGVSRFLAEMADAVRAHLAHRATDCIGAAPDPLDELPPVA